MMDSGWNYSCMVYSRATHLVAISLLKVYAFNVAVYPTKQTRKYEEVSVLTTYKSPKNLNIRINHMYALRFVLTTRFEPAPRRLVIRRK